MIFCQGVTIHGRRCQMRALPGLTLCRFHNPATRADVIAENNKRIAAAKARRKAVAAALSATAPQ
jgi:hypothetical protein